MTPTAFLPLRPQSNKELCPPEEFPLFHSASSNSSASSTCTALICSASPPILSTAPDEDSAVATMQENAPQPEFAAAAQHLEAFAVEVSRVANTPAAREGNQILDALNRMDSRLNAIENRLGRIERRLDGMSTPWSPASSIKVFVWMPVTTTITLTYATRTSTMAP
ncbi:hypothetical protein J1614_001385 [Plenodomus biglobosus]|nr:hypothetical protein J1614_001385 [Plenodomus biglobosus]